MCQFLDYHIYKNSTPSNPYQSTHALALLNCSCEIAKLWQNVRLS